MAVTFDTLKAFTRLRESGFDEKQATALVELMSEVLAFRASRIEADTLPTGCDDLRIAVAPELSERLGESARRGGVSLATAARAALERGLADGEAELRQPRELDAPMAVEVEPFADRPPADDAPPGHQPQERNGH